MKLTSIPQIARNINRVREIVTILSKYGLADWINRLDLNFAKGLFKARDGAGLAEQSFETRIRLVLTELGTTFIKLGQMLSTRPDLVGAALAKELTELQSNTPADPPEAVRKTIAAELGLPVEELFADFDPHPLASASIGQVHQARLKDGTAVVVKVQHAGIEARVRTDLDILIALADLAEKYLPELKRYRPRVTAVDFQRTLLRELDFGREERNLQQFLTSFGEDSTVRFPAPHSEFSTGRVLTMERLEGIKLADTDRLRKEGVDLEAIARRGAELFLEMIFRDGFYHADPHPGNILVLSGDVIGVLDCGMVGRLDETMREQIEEMLFAIASADPAQLTAVITRTGAVPPDLDQAALGADLTEFLSYYGGQSLDQFDLGGALTEMVEIIRRYHILLPSGMAMLIKVLIMLEGTARLLNPHFNLIELIKPYHQTLLLRRLSPLRHLKKLQRLYTEWEYLGEQLPRGISDILQQVRTGRATVHLEHQSMEPSVNRLVFGMITSALFVGSALLWSHRIPPLVGEVSLVGALGCVISVALGLRLLLAIKKSGHLDHRN